MLWKAHEEGRNFQVICTETRPAFQGRITAKEMLSMGVKTTFIVDSAARSFMHDADMVIVGADAITSEGNVVNKIGTAAIALLAHEARKPFYVVSELLKFDPATLYGEYEKIEERSRDEIWKEAPPELNVRNPAFDVTPRDLIHGIICEEGIVSPQSVGRSHAPSIPMGLRVDYYAFHVSNAIRSSGCVLAYSSKLIPFITASTACLIAKAPVFVPSGCPCRPPPA